MKLDYKDQALSAEVLENGTVKGYASKFNIMDHGKDIVMKGAFSGNLTAPKMLYNHDVSKIAGVWDKVVEDDVGLWVEGRINLDTAVGKDLYSNINFGAIDALSIGYAPKRAVKNNKGARELHKVDLFEISFVTFPMLPEAKISSVKTVQDQSNENISKFVENYLIEADFSEQESKAAAAAIVKMRGIGPPDADQIIQAIKTAFLNM